MFDSEAQSRGWLPISYTQEKFPAKVMKDLLVPVRADRYRCLESDSGLSAARIWHVIGQQGEYCLRQWPRSHPSAEKLTEIHRCLFFARSYDLSIVPHVILPGLGLPICRQPSFGETFVEVGGQYWELLQWLPGTANFWSRPNSERLRSAGRSLGKLHAVWQIMPWSSTAGDVDRQPAPAVAERLKLLVGLTPTVVGDLETALRRFTHRAWFAHCERILQEIGTLRPTLLSELAYYSRYSFRCQHVMRDIWHDHVLFLGDNCSGLIDFGAMRIDTVATDLVRMFGSLTKSAPNSTWADGLSEYEKENKLSEIEMAVLGSLYRSSVLLSGVQWVRWLTVDELQFPGKETFVTHRLADLATEIQSIVDSK